MKVVVIALTVLVGVGVGAYVLISRCAPSNVPSYAGISISSVIVKELAPGLDGGKAIGPGRHALIHYKAYVYDPAQRGNLGPLISESPEGQPLNIEWDGGQFPVGWQQGLAGMRDRSKRELVIPIELAAGKVAGKAVPEGAMVLLQAYVERVD
jgi:FKBP-type peptidyl-prolyl cis-trans isomerase